MPETLTRNRGDTLTPVEQAVLDDIELHYDKDAADPFDMEVPDTPESIIEPPEQADGEDGSPTATNYDLVLVDQSKDARDFARDRADARLTEELNEGGRFKRLAKGVWKGNIARDYYRQKYIREAQSDIEANQDVLTHEVADANRRGRALQATIERFQTDQEGLIHENAGERREELDGESSIAAGLKGVIAEYARGALDDEALQEERSRIIEAYREAHGNEAIGEGIVQVDNILTIARSVRGAVEQGESLDNIMRGMRIISGEARSGARTAAHYDKVDRVIDKLAQSKIGSIVAPEIVTAAVTTAASLLRMGSKAAVGAAAMTVLPGLGAGIMAGLRERKRTKDERVQHAREMAQGKQFDAGDKRREQMEATRYETRTAIELHDELQSRFDSDQLDAGGHEALRAAMDALAAVEARVSYSNEGSLDLISYSDAASVTDERMKLDIAIAEARVHADRRLDPDSRQALGLEADASVEDYLAQRVDAFYDLLEDDMSSKDRVARKLEVRRSLTAAGAGLAAGLTLGIAAQEIGAILSDSRSGLVEQLWHADTKLHDGAEHRTLLHGLVGDNEAYGGEKTELIDGKTEFSLPSEYSIGKNDDGSLNILSSDGTTIVEHVKLNADGTLPPESLDQLRGTGMIVEDLSFAKDATSIETKTVGLDEYLLNHEAETTHITRDFWYDNNTSWADRNETGINWGGAGFDAQGNYHMNINGMTEGGSSHDGQSVNWQSEAQSGNLQVAISASQGSQSEVFMLNIGPDGNVTIPYDSPAAKFFEDTGNGPVFNGQYAEIVQKAGIDGNGVEHVRPLATFVGEGNITTLQDTVETRSTVVEPSYKLMMPPQQETFTEMVPVIPVASRRSLENVRQKSVLEAANPYYNRYDANGGDGLLSPEILTARRAETSPRLLAEPEQTLNPREELSWYRKQLFEKMGAGYLGRIDAAISASPELSNMSGDLRTILTIPVKASGNAESKNIYNLLTKAYAGQGTEAIERNMILLHVNWFDEAEDDPDLKANIDLTLAEIQRAKQDFPDLKVAVIRSVWDEEDRKGGVIGHVGRRMNDAALLAVERAMREGRIVDDQKILVVRNDADTQGLARNYISSYQEAAEANPETDIFTGTTQYGSARASDLPGFVFSANFMQSMDTLNAIRENSTHTGNANFAVRLEMLAAIGGNGFEDAYTGSGSDDVAIGRRIADVRGGRLGVSGGSRFGGYRALRDHFKKRSGVSSGETSSNTPRRVGRRIAGARLDTNGDRQESLYLQGIPMLGAWDNGAFDVGGHAERDATVEDLRAQYAARFNEPEVLVESIRKDMERSLYIGSSSTRQTALAMAFSGLSNDTGTSPGDGYNLETTGYDSAGNPILHLSLTDVGKAYILNHLRESPSGRPDPYGRRLARQLYGEGKVLRGTRSRRPLMIRTA